MDGWTAGWRNHPTPPKPPGVTLSLACLQQAPLCEAQDVCAHHDHVVEHADAFGLISRIGLLAFGLRRPQRLWLSGCHRGWIQVNVIGNE